MKDSNKYQRELQARHKQTIFDLLGGVCKHCGFSDSRALQIDHINGGGVKELNSIGNKRSYYSRVIRSIQAGEGKYQLLCANCNWIKRWEKDELNPSPTLSN